MRIDLDEIIKKKSVKLYNKLPRFVLFVLKKILKQDNINDVLDYCGDVKGIEFLHKALDRMNVQREFVNIDKLDKTKKYIFASNHPLGGLDGMVIVEGVSQMGGAKILANDILMAIEPLRECFIPVNKFGRQNQNSLLTLKNELNSDNQIIFFPAGVCSRKRDGVVTDLKWQKSFLVKAVESKRDVVPVFVDNVNSYSFYMLEVLRKKFGIKQNLEMFLLPSQMFKKKIQRIKIIFGQPIDYRLIEQSGDYEKWTEIVRSKVYELKNN